MMHLLRLTFRFQLSSGKTILSAVFRVNLESALRVPKHNQLFMRVHRWNSSLACQAIALKDSHLSLVTSGHFLILPSASFLSVPTIRRLASESGARSRPHLGGRPGKMS